MPAGRSNAVKSFVAKHAEKIKGVLECFDRVIIRGHLPLAAPGYFSTWLYSKRISLNLKEPPAGWWNFKEVAPCLAEGLKAYAQSFAKAAGRPYQHLPTHDQKMEESARALAEADGIEEGLEIKYLCMGGD